LLLSLPLGLFFPLKFFLFLFPYFIKAILNFLVSQNINSSTALSVAFKFCEYAASLTDVKSNIFAALYLI
jgi:hypothetical protein